MYQNRIQEIDYTDKVFNAYYFYAYGYAYAFEYALIYKIVLSIYNAPSIGIYSLGCGSMIDAWAVLYAVEKLGNKVNSLDYTGLFYNGLDKSEWELDFKKYLDEFNSDSINRKRFFYNEMDTRKIQDIVSFFKSYKERNVQKSIFFFPKILNELGPEDGTKILKALEKSVKNFNRKEYYFCVSHSKRSLKEGVKLLDDMIKIFTDNGFVVDKTLEKTCFNNINIEVIEEDGGYEFTNKAFKLKSNNWDEHISLINNDFDRFRTNVFENLDRFLLQDNEKILEQIDKFQRENKPQEAEKLKRINENLKHPITTLKNIRFQIIKLIKKSDINESETAK